MLPMQYPPLEMCAAVLGRAAALELNKAEPVEAEPKGSAPLPVTSSAFHSLHAAIFPATQKQTKGAEEK